MGCLPSKDRKIVSLAVAPAALPAAAASGTSAGAAAPSPAPPLAAAEDGVAGPDVALPAAADAPLLEPRPIRLVDPRSFPTEEQRAAVLKATGMVGTPSERCFDAITELMGYIFQTPVALLTMLVEDQVMFKSKWGPMGACVQRPGSWCDWTLVPASPEVLVCEDATKDARFSSSPYVAGPPFIRFYAGAPLLGSSSPAGSATFRQAASQLEGVLLLDVRQPGWRVMYANDRFSAASGVGVEEATKQGAFWEQFEDVGTLPGEMPTRQRVAAALAAGAPACLSVHARQTGHTLHLVLMPASSDQVFPSGRSSGVPNWVASEAAPGQPDFATPRGALLGGSKDKPGAAAGTGRGAAQPAEAAAAAAAASAAEALPRAAPASSYWFAVLQPPEWVAAPASGPAGLGVCTGRDSSAAASAAAEAGSGSGGAAAPATPTTPGLNADRGAHFSPTSGSPAATGRGAELSVFGGFEEDLTTYGSCRLPPELERELTMGPLIGAGSFGKVYRAVWRGSQAVAVKLIECRQGSRQAADAMAEAALSHGWDHAHLVKTFLHVLQPRPKGRGLTIWIVQQLCTHGTLLEAAEAGLLRRERSLSAPPDMRAVLLACWEVASALAYLHARGVIHRDLTGNNVLLDAAEPTAADPRGWVCRVGDFGMARLAAGEEASTETYGTVTHCAPEVMCEGLLTPASDVWSFGVLAHEAYCGIRCFAGLPMPTVIYRVTSGKHPLELPDGAPDGFKVLVGACLSRDHTQRPSFDSILASLERLLAAEVSPPQAGR
ncbi:hypothetical protein ABPG75_005723 [Micractinium tetrahymenae]